MVFLWFSHGFPMVIPMSHIFGGSRQISPFQRWDLSDPRINIPCVSWCFNMGCEWDLNGVYSVYVYTVSTWADGGMVALSSQVAASQVPAAAASRYG